MATMDACGMWDFPSQQDSLADLNLLRPNTPEAFQKASEILGCEATYRGYLVVKRKEIN